MKQLQPITDPVFVGKFQYSFLERLFLGLIRDERDLPFVQLTAKISILVLPLAVLLYVPAIQGWVWWAIALAYAYFNNFVFKGPFGLMLHCTSHRVLFKKKVDYLNHYLPWFIAPFFGHSPETYYAHHIGMHHAENNLQEDESSTMPYQRDSVKAFRLYFVQFLFTGVYHLALYFFRKNRRKLLYRSVRGELLFIAFCILLAIINFKATLWVFILPFLLYRLIAMMGNWAQHAFIDPVDPGNPYKNSVTCINTRYNHKCWNDGYHISHHERQNMHWTEHPAYFLKTLDRYVVNEAVVFDNIHFLHIFIWLMRKRYDLLARHFVNIGNRFATEDEVIAFLKTRTKKFSITHHSLAHA
jgi:hypothetical protein